LKGASLERREGGKADFQSIGASGVRKLSSQFQRPGQLRPEVPQLSLLNVLDHCTISRAVFDKQRQAQVLHDGMISGTAFDYQVLSN